MVLNYKNEFLKIEKVDILKIAKEYPTPIYVYSANMIEKNYNDLKSKLKKNIYYSVKANSNQAIISLLSRLGSGTDVVSGEELLRVLSAGVKSNKIIFEGVGKTRNDLVIAIENNIKQINVESIGEFKLIDDVAKSLNKKANVGVRINPDIDAKTHDKISTGRKNDKFGIGFNEIEESIKTITSLKNIKFNGISCHIGSQIFSLDVFNKMFAKIKEAEKIYSNNNLKIQNLNLGGGMGYDYEKKKSFDIGGLSLLVNKFFSNENYEISFEPGRYLVANSGVLITKILMIKESENNNFLIIDAGMNTLLRPALYKAFHNIVPLNKQKDKIDYCVVGPICENSDIFLRKISLPKQKIGDLLAIEDVGAYGSVMSSNYNSKILPAEIMVKDNKYEIIRNSQSLDDLISRDNVPSWI